jgi:F-type H+-transporting ATPase subunit epsilon
MAESNSSSHRTLQCVIVTPEATVLDTEASFVALPLYDGELGVAVKHSPMIGRLGYGELRIKNHDHERHYYVDGGFVQVVGDVVSVLTSRAIPADKLDAGAAAEQLRSAICRPASGEEQIAIRERNTLQARGQLRVASKR